MEPFISHRNVERDALEDSALICVNDSAIEDDGIASTELEIPWTFTVLFCPCCCP